MKKKSILYYNFWLQTCVMCCGNPWRELQKDDEESIHPNQGQLFEVLASIRRGNAQSPKKQKQNSDVGIVEVM